MILKNLLCLFVIALFVPFRAFADEYTNPIIDADYSDPDVIRVGDDFYLTASSSGQSKVMPTTIGSVF
jgi:beta-xylosidase